jgi:hypothetical protein
MSNPVGVPQCSSRVHEPSSAHLLRAEVWDTSTRLFLDRRVRVIALGGGRDGSGRGGPCRGGPLLVIWFVVLGSLPTVVSEYEQVS